MNKQSPQKVSHDEAKHLLDTLQGVVMLDVREEEEYATGHAAGASLLPVDEINNESAHLIIGDKSVPVIVYCKTGQRAELACEKLSALGYTHIYNAGSLTDWKYGIEY